MTNYLRILLIAIFFLANDADYSIANPTPIKTYGPVDAAEAFRENFETSTSRYPNRSIKGEMLGKWILFQTQLHITEAAAQNDGSLYVIADDSGITGMTQSNPRPYKIQNGKLLNVQLPYSKSGYTSLMTIVSNNPSKPTVINTEDGTGHLGYLQLIGLNATEVSFKESMRRDQGILKDGSLCYSTVRIGGVAVTSRNPNSRANTPLVTYPMIQRALALGNNAKTFIDALSLTCGFIGSQNILKIRTVNTDLIFAINGIRLDYLAKGFLQAGGSKSSLIMTRPNDTPESAASYAEIESP